MSKFLNDNCGDILVDTQYISTKDVEITSLDPKSKLRVSINDYYKFYILYNEGKGQAGFDVENSLTFVYTNKVIKLNERVKALETSFKATEEIRSNVNALKDKVGELENKVEGQLKELEGKVTNLESNQRRNFYISITGLVVSITAVAIPTLTSFL